MIEAGADINRKNTRGSTALHEAAHFGQNEVTAILIKAGADINRQDNYGLTALHRAAENGHNKVTTTLMKAGAELNIQNKYGKTALENAARHGPCDVVTTLMEAGADVPPSLANKMMNTNPVRISSVLNFLSKKLHKLQNEYDFQKTKENLGIEIMEGDRLTMFYNVPCEYLDDKSLLEYIDIQNVHLIRQREELIDLALKIANLNNRDDTENAMDEVINHFKSGLPSGVGLRDMLSQIKERYPWPNSKKIILIFVSLVACLLGIGMYVFDLTTDVLFSLDIMQTRNESSNGTEEFANFLPFPSLKSDFPECFADMNSAFNKNYNRTTDFDDFLSNNYFNYSSLKSDHQSCFADLNSSFKKKNNKTFAREDYGVTAWISIWHCIQPFVVTVAVFISINYNNFSKGYSGLKFSLPEIPNVPEWLKDSCFCLNCLLCCIPFKLLWPLGYLGYRLFKGLAAAFLIVSRSVPLPAFTNIYRFYLDVRSHHARSKPYFRIYIVDIEEEIREHEALGKFLRSSENYTILIITF